MSSSSPPPTPLSNSTTPSSPPSEPALSRLRGFLKKLLRVSTTDGRVFIGMFVGTDKPLNIILINAEEYRLGPDQDPDGRFVGQVMLPWKVIVKVEVHVQETQLQRNDFFDEMLYM